MGCNNCKGNKSLKHQMMTKMSTFEKVAIIVLVILLALAGYGAYSLIQKVI
jgi:hypothetical protein